MNGEVLPHRGEIWWVRLDPASEPPAKLPLTLVLALPRPRVLKRCLAAAAALGVEHLVLLGAWRVEKSYWQSPVLAERERYLCLGLEQVREESGAGGAAEASFLVGECHQLVRNRDADLHGQRVTRGSYPVLSGKMFGARAGRPARAAGESFVLGSGEEG